MTLGLQGVTVTGGYGFSGGAVIIGEGMPVVLDHCTFVSNRAEDFGGAVYGESSSPRITNCLFVDNSAAKGGAVYFAYARPNMEFCTFAGNGADDGGAFYVKSAPACSLFHCTFAFNEAPRGSGITLLTSTAPAVVIETTILSFGAGGEGLYWDGAGALDLASVDIHGNEGGDWIGVLAPRLGIDGNVDLDPLFCDPARGEFTLMSASPCLPENNPEGVLIGAHGEGCGTTIGVAAAAPRAPGSILLGNSPNPFNPVTTITYEIAGAGRVTLAVYDIAGRRIATLLDGPAPAGPGTLSWNGENDSGRPAPSGAYVLRLTTETNAVSRKISLVR